MCRVLTYIGNPILVEDLFYKTDNSLVKQSYSPRFMTNLLNLAGFGMIAWDPTSQNSKIPFVYKTTALPFYDDNLHNLARKIKASCLLAHIRGVVYNEKQVISKQNVHPFIFENNINIVLAHNGHLRDIEKMQYDLLRNINPVFRKQIQGTTDSELIYGIFLSQLVQTTKIFDIDTMMEVFVNTIKILKRLRNKYGIFTTSPINLFLTNGTFIAATRFTLDYGWPPSNLEYIEHLSYHSLWYTFGEEYGCYNREYKMKNGGITSACIIASEPLTEDTNTWIEVPEYTMIVASKTNKSINISLKDIPL